MSDLETWLAASPSGCPRLNKHVGSKREESGTHKLKCSPSSWRELGTSVMETERDIREGTEGGGGVAKESVCY